MAVEPACGRAARRPEIDAVAVCVPTPLHVEVALAALDAGKRVLIEKPLAPSPERRRRIC
jgi:predicted dehydrogenase